MKVALPMLPGDQLADIVLKYPAIMRRDAPFRQGGHGHGGSEWLFARSRRYGYQFKDNQYVYERDGLDKAGWEVVDYIVEVENEYGTQ